MQRPIALIKCAIVMAALLSTANGFFLTAYHLTMARVDPIVFPLGTSPKAGHVHNVVGSANFGVDSTFDKLRAAPCTSVENTADKSAYWQPSIHSRLPNGTLVPLPMYEARIYYLLDHGPNVTVPPKGLRIVGGDAMARDPVGNATKGTRYATIGCQMGSLRNSTNEYQGRGFIKNLMCGAFLRTSVALPECWDGKRTDSLPDHISHMAYARLTVCPDSHPIRIPTIIIEYGYISRGFDPASLVLSSGDDTGYGLHVDYFMGWDSDVLAKAIADPTCVKRQIDYVGDSGGLCDALKATHDKNAAVTCKLATKVPQESVGLTTPITELPGCNLVSSSGPKPCSAAQINNISTTLVDPTYVKFGPIGPNVAIAAF